MPDIVDCRWCAAADSLHLVSASVENRMTKMLVPVLAGGGGSGRGRGEGGRRGGRCDARGQAGEGGENTAIAADDGAAAGLAVNCCHRHGGRHCCPSDGIDDYQLPEEASMNVSALVILEQFFDRSHA